MSDRTLTFESAGLKGRVNNVPQTAQEWDELAGPDGLKCYDCAMDYIKFHVILDYFRDDMMDSVMEQTQIEATKKQKKNTKGEVVKDDKGQPVMVTDEKPVNYIARVAAQLGKKESDFQALADDWSKTKNFVDFLKPRARRGAAGAKDLEAAQIILTDGARFARVRANLAQEGINIVENATAEQLALGIREMKKKIEARMTA